MVGMKKLLNISKITMKLGAAVPYSHNNFKVFFKVFHSNLINPNILKLDRHINSDVFFRKIWFILLWSTFITWPSPFLNFKIAN